MGNWRKIAGRAFFGEGEKQIQSEGYRRSDAILGLPEERKFPASVTETK